MMKDQIETNDGFITYKGRIQCIVLYRINFRLLA